MSNKQWSLAHRPTTLEEMVVGNPEVLVGAVSIAKTAQAVLISGTSGTGKTTLARILARRLNGDLWEEDLLEINGATDFGINDVRNLMQRLQYAPKHGKTVVIIDEAHAITGAAAKAVLKLLEDPPHAKVLFALCTDQPWKLPQSVTNRCRVVDIRPPSPLDLAKYLLRIARREKLDLDRDELKKIALRISKNTNGVVRQAVQDFESACALLASGEPVKEVIHAINGADDVDLNKVVGSILIALYSKGEPDKAAEFIFKRATQVDCMGLLHRLQSANHFGLSMALGGPFNWQGKVYAEALGSKKLNPELQSVIFVSHTLNTIREQLREIITDPNILIAGELANLPYAMKRRSQ